MGTFVVSLGPLSCTFVANAITHVLLLCPLVIGKAVLCLICGPWAVSSLECSLQSQASLHSPLPVFPHLEGRANDTCLPCATVISQLPADRFGSSMVKVYGKRPRIINICIRPLLRMSPLCAPDGRQGLLLLKNKCCKYSCRHSALL